MDTRWVACFHNLRGRTPTDALTFLFNDGGTRRSIPLPRGRVRGDAARGDVKWKNWSDDQRFDMIWLCDDQKQLQVGCEHQKA